MAIINGTNGNDTLKDTADSDTIAARVVAYRQRAIPELTNNTIAQHRRVQRRVLERNLRSDQQNGPG